MAQYVSIASLIFHWHWHSPAPGPARWQRSLSRASNLWATKSQSGLATRSFAATLSDNATATAFKKLLPLSVTMTELNGNEKLFRLPGTLPARASTPSSIQTGDLMLYGPNTLVLFYKSFPTTYSYTTIGRIDDPAGLEAALGSGTVAVTFEVRRDKR